MEYSLLFMPRCCVAYTRDADIICKTRWMLPQHGRCLAAAIRSWEPISWDYRSPSKKQFYCRLPDSVPIRGLRNQAQSITRPESLVFRNISSVCIKAQVRQHEHTASNNRASQRLNQILPCVSKSSSWYREHPCSYVVPRHRFQESALSKESRMWDLPSCLHQVFSLETTSITFLESGAGRH